jgi:hypothetical protein
MEILNSVWTVGVIAVVLILGVYCRFHFNRSGWAPNVKLSAAFMIFLMGDVIQRSTIWWWHHQFNIGIKLPLDVYYPQLALGCSFAIVGTFILLRILSESYWGWPSCLKVSALVLILAAVLVYI